MGYRFEYRDVLTALSTPCVKTLILTSRPDIVVTELHALLDDIPEVKYVVKDRTFKFDDASVRVAKLDKLDDFEKFRGGHFHLICLFGTALTFYEEQFFKGRLYNLKDEHGRMLYAGKIVIQR